MGKIAIICNRGLTGPCVTVRKWRNESTKAPITPKGYAWATGLDSKWYYNDRIDTRPVNPIVQKRYGMGGRVKRSI